MEELVECAREELYSGNEIKIQQLLLQCFDRLAVDKKNINPDKVNYFNEAMRNLSFAMQDQDYLLVTDILKFEILPCLKKGVY